MTQEKLLKKIRKSYDKEVTLKNLLRGYTYEGYDLNELFSDYNSEGLAKLLLEDSTAIKNLIGRQKEYYNVLNTPYESNKYRLLGKIIESEVEPSVMVSLIEYYNYKGHINTNYIKDRIDYLIRVYNVNKDEAIVNLIVIKSEKKSFEFEYHYAYAVYSSSEYDLSDEKIRNAMLNLMYKNLGDVNLLTDKDYKIFIDRAIHEKNVDYLYQFLISGRTEYKELILRVICIYDDGTYACKLTDDYDNGRIDLTDQDLNDLQEVVMNSKKTGMKFALVYKNNKKLVLENFDNSYSKIYAYYSMLSEEDKKDVPKAYVDEILMLAKQEFNAEDALEEKKEEEKDTLVNRMNKLVKDINEKGPVYIDGAIEKGKKITGKAGEKGKEISSNTGEKLKETRDVIIKNIVAAKDAYDMAKKTKEASNKFKEFLNTLNVEENDLKETDKVNETNEEEINEKDALRQMYEEEAEEVIGEMKKEAKAFVSDVKSYIDDAKVAAPAYARTLIRMFRGEDEE